MSGRCESVRSALAGYLGDELPRDELVSVRDHLRDCAACRVEAGAYLQAQKALQRAAAAALAEPFDDDDLHEQILARVALEQASLDAEPRWTQRLMVAAAAVLLAAFGFWLAGRPPAPSIWERPATQPGSPEHVVGSPLQALPYVGPPVDLRPVGLDDGIGGSAANGFGPGMMGRGERSELRDLVNEDLVLPQQPR